MNVDFLLNLFSKSVTWRIPTNEKILYFTFDDGPIPEVTPWVLDTLARYNAKATFFCVGENVEKHPAIFKAVLEAGHAIGNHTYHHLKGWKTRNEEYFRDVETCAAVVPSVIFRPPYGKMRISQWRHLKKKYRIILWDVLSKDYLENLNGAAIVQSVIKKARPGSIIVFHDSIKAWDRLHHSLPLLLEHFSKENYRFEKINFIK